LLYVGKAKDLQKRVASYFKPHLEDPRIESMVGQIGRAEFSVVNTEVEALVLESRLIKEERPHYNIRLRDGSGYPYLHLSLDKDVPQLTIQRSRTHKHGKYFGPYPNQHAVRAAHDLLQRHFGLRTCSDTFFANRSRPCLEYQIGRCTAPCVGRISKDDYRQRVAELDAFLSGQSSELLGTLSGRMTQAAQAQDFERAAYWRDRISTLRQLQDQLAVEGGEGSFQALACALDPGQACVSVVVVRDGQMVGHRNHTFVPPPGASAASVLGQFIAQQYLQGEMVAPPLLLVDPLPEDAVVLEQALGESQGHAVALRDQARGMRRRQLALATRNAQACLAVANQSQVLMDQRRKALAVLLDLDAPPARIECFDVSHTQGELPVASCVVFGLQGAQRKDYRRYNLRDITPGDDYAGIHQAVTRRLAKPGPLPDLLLIDGGAGQVAKAVEVARGLGMTFPIVGVSKGPERRAGDEVLILDDGARTLAPGPASAGLHLIQAVRDESHRFALAGHTRRRDQARTRSPLQSIPGIGPSRRRALLTAFGGLQGVQQATMEQLLTVPGIGPKQAQAIITALAH
jgi:excinuclease ABC subunit C